MTRRLAGCATALLILLSTRAVLAQSSPGTEAVATQATLSFGKPWRIRSQTGKTEEPSELIWNLNRNRCAQLMPQNGAAIRRLSTRKFAAISDKHLERLEYGPDAIPGETLDPGTVLALRTASGHLVKLLIVQYRIQGVVVTDPEFINNAVSGDAVSGDAVSGDAVSGDAVSGDAVSGDAVSGDAVSGDAVSGDAVSGNAVSGNAVSGNAVQPDVQLDVQWVRYTSRRGTTVVPGTWTWDLDLDALGPDAGHDLWWEQEDPKTQNLKVANDARVAIVNETFGEVSLDDLRRLDISGQSVSHRELKPGAVIAIRTSKGALAKLCVSRYLSSHDFSFGEAEVMQDRWKDILRGKPENQSYHIELKWTVFPGRHVVLPAPNRRD